ncbi:MAG TPA: hypothetical protein DF715_04900 [Oceanicaulis sp.]|nr:hypothetical protein [Oceanicaulis sp.]
MAEMKSIEIDFEVHQRIEAARKGFGETPNTVLRRLLEIDRPGRATPPPGPAQALGLSKREPRPWFGKGVTLPHGTLVRMDYNGRVHSGQIDDGGWLVEGKRFKSPSGAASGIAVTGRGDKTRLDGWKYWSVKLPASDVWHHISTLRRAG